MPGTDPRAAAWVASGAAFLTGLPDGPGLVPPASVLARIALLGQAVQVDPWTALTERAAVAGLRRRGQVSCGGGTRLLPAGDGWIAVSLVRRDDVDLVPAWLTLDGTPDPGRDEPPGVGDATPGAAGVGHAGHAGVGHAGVGRAGVGHAGVGHAGDAGVGEAGEGDAGGGHAGAGHATPGDARAAPLAEVDAPWSLVAAGVAARPVADLVERGVLLGLPVAAVGEAAEAAVRPPGAAAETGARRAAGETPGAPPGRLPGRAVRLGRPGGAPGRGGADRRDRPPLVVDLSSLWAGPVCARILGEAGAVVIKVEATARPDGGRRGPATFYDRLHTGHRAVALDLAADEGRTALRALVAAADVVIEASRPRALRQLDIDPVGLGAHGPRAWLSITGHGRTGEAARRVGFGDDAAAAGGLVAPTVAGPVFVGDAVADPLTGMAAAAAALDLLDRGGRWLVDLPLAAVAAWVAATDGVATAADIPKADTRDATDAVAAAEWRPVDDPPAPPPLPRPATPAPAVGADTEAVLDAVRSGRPVDAR